MSKQTISFTQIKKALTSIGVELTPEQTITIIKAKTKEKETEDSDSDDYDKDKSFNEQVEDEEEIEKAIAKKEYELAALKSKFKKGKDKSADSKKLDEIMNVPENTPADYSYTKPKSKNQEIKKSEGETILESKFNELAELLKGFSKNMEERISSIENQSVERKSVASRPLEKAFDNPSDEQNKDKSALSVTHNKRAISEIPFNKAGIEKGLANNLEAWLGGYSAGQHDGQVLFDNASQQDTMNLIKSLEAVGLTTASGAPLQVVSLENTLKLLTFKEAYIAFWKKIPKLLAYNNEVLEGDVKLLAVTKMIPLSMQLVKTNISDIITGEVKNGILSMLRKVDRALVYGDSDIVPEEFNGLIAQQRNRFSVYNDYMNSNNVIDLRGKYLKEKDIKTGSMVIAMNYGLANYLIAPPVVLTDYVSQFYKSNNSISNGVIGQQVQTIQTQYGQVDLGYDVFLNADPPRKIGDGTSHSMTPSVPIAAANPVEPVAVSSFSKFSAKESTAPASYFYAVAAKNRHGLSPLLDISAGAVVSVNAGGAVDLKFTAGAGANPASGFVIYRSQPNATGTIGDNPLYPIFEVSAAQLSAGYDGGAAGTVRDNNRFLAGCQQAILLQCDNETLVFKQLAPLIKMNLPTLSPATRFMLLLYGTPLLYSPLKMVRYINIGRVQ